MNYEEAGQLMTDGDFRTRCKVAVLKFADAIISSRGMNFSTTIINWARRSYVEPDVTVHQVVPATVLDPAVMNYGKDINDDNLQAAVEAVVQKQNQ